jgi:hypothetical protein
MEGGRRISPQTQKPNSAYGKLSENAKNFSKPPEYKLVYKWAMTVQ